MKTTLELPDELFSSVKVRAAQQGISMKEYVAAVLREKLGQTSEHTGERLRMKHFGSLAHLRKETRRIERIIEQEFETIDPDAWEFA
jgi:plasmid stability protein